MDSGNLGRARGRPDDEAEPADWLHGGATAAFRSVRWPGRTANPAVRSRGRPIGSSAPVSLFSHPLSLCGRRFLSGPPPLVLAVSARCSVCLGCHGRACGCTGGRCRSDGRRTTAAAASRPHRPKSAGQPGRGRFGGGPPDRAFLRSPAAGRAPKGCSGRPRRRTSRPHCGGAGAAACRPTGNFSRPACRYGLRWRRRLAVRRQIGGLWWRFLRRRRRNRCAAIRLHPVGHGRCVCAFVGSCQPLEH